MTSQLENTPSDISYDDLPYTAHPFPQTHPARLAAIAQIRGIKAPDASRARVLEIGCAAGGNLIPMAARLPNARFVGVDLSKRQIADGQGRIRRLGLSNIELRHANLMTVSVDDGCFDYIICHGVYSWVPKPVRDAILRICKNNLSASGIAFISYNVLPGWRLRQTLRDALALSIPREDKLQLKVEKARRLIALYSENANEGSAWGQIFRDEAARLSKTPDDYVGHEFLEDCNEPCSFTEFMVDATQSGLMFVAEAQLVALLPETACSSAAPTIRSLASDRILEMQQHIDIFTGRTFRQSLLTHRESEPSLLRDFSSCSLEGLHLSPRADFQFRDEKDGRALFGTKKGAHVEVGDLYCRRALETLISRFPASSTVDQLAQEIAVRGPDDQRKARDQIADILLKLAFMGAISISTLPTQATSAVGDRPVACPFLRRDVASGSLISANLAHESVSVDPILQLVLPMMDGRAEIRDLTDVLVEAAKNGAIEFKSGSHPIEAEEAMVRYAKERLAEALFVCRNNAVLIM